MKQKITKGRMFYPLIDISKWSKILMICISMQLTSYAQNTYVSSRQRQEDGEFNYDMNKPTGRNAEKGLIELEVRFSSPNNGAAYRDINFATLTGITFSFTGTSVSDISGYTLFEKNDCCGVREFPIISTNTVGNTVTIVPDYKFRIPSWAGTSGTYMFRFLIKAKIAANAGVGNTIDAVMTSFSIDNASIADFTSDGSMSRVSTINNALSGIFTVNTSQATSGTNFNNIGDLSETLVNVGVATGGVVIKFKDGQTFDYSTNGYENELVIPSYASDANRPLVITRSNDGAAKPVITMNAGEGWASTQNKGIRIDGSDYVTIDGLNFIVPNVTTGPNSGNRRGIIWFNNSNTNGSTNIAITNNNFIMNGKQNSFSDFCCDFVGLISTNFLNNMSVPSLTNSNISGNLFTDFKVGIRIWDNDGGSTAVNDNNEYGNNTMTGFSLIGMQLMQHSNAKIHHNHISGLLANKGGADGREEPHVIGLSESPTFGPYKIYNNVIHSLTNTGTGNLRVFSIDQDNSVVSEIYNNMIYDIHVPASTDNFPVRVFDLKGTDGGKYKIYHNSIVLNNVTANNKRSAIFKSDHSNDKYDLRNNILINNGGGTGIANIFYEDWSGANSISATSNNNIYYSTSSAFTLFDSNNGVVAAALADLKTATNAESNSYAEAVPFISATNLHLQSGQPSAAVGGGTSTAGILFDIDGQARSNTAPFIGADELSILVTSVSISGANTISTYNGTLPLLSTIAPTNASSQMLDWQTNLPAIATVSGSGVLQALANGVVTVTAISNPDGIVSNKFIVTITGQAPSSVSVSPANATLTGNTLTLTSTIVPTVANQGLTWTSSNNSIATVSDGVVSSVSNGVVTITAVSSVDASKSATSIITVDIPVIALAGVTISGMQVLTVGSDIVLTASYAPQNAAMPVTTTWSVDNNSIAGFNNPSLGTLSGLSPGAVNIMVTAMNSVSTVSGSFVVTVVTAPVNQIALTGDVTITGLPTLAPGESSQLTAEYLPANAATPIIVEWSVDNQSVATISGSGLLMAIADGVVIVSVKVSNAVSTIMGMGVVTVTQATVPSGTITGIALSGAESMIDLDQTNKTLQVIVTASPTGATIPGIAWSTSNASIATVSGSGLVTGLSVGVVTITATLSTNSAISATYEINVARGTSVDNEIASAIKLYPNPTNSFVNFDAPGIHIQSIKIFNAIGSEVHLQSSTDPISVAGFVRGLYFVQIKVGEVVFVKTLSVQ